MQPLSRSTIGLIKRNILISGRQLHGFAGFRSVCAFARPHVTNHCGIPVISFNRSLSSSASSPFGGVTINKSSSKSAAAAESEDYMDKEKRLFALQRKMGAAYAGRHYEEALKIAVSLEDAVIEVHGKKNAVYASCRANIALMNKHLNYNDSAIQQYSEALQVYESVYQTRKHVRYAATLANLGLCFKAAGDNSKGLERLQHYDRAEEALSDALGTRMELLGSSHKETILSANYYGTLLFARNKTAEGEKQLLEALDTAIQSLGNVDLTVALVRNNLGYGYKRAGRFEDALGQYMEAFDIRSKLLGDDHADSIVVMNNIAELYDAQGDAGAAREWRKRIFAAAGVDEEEAMKADLREHTSGDDADEDVEEDDGHEEGSLEAQQKKTVVTVTRSNNNSSNNNDKSIHPSTGPLHMVAAEETPAAAAERRMKEAMDKYSDEMVSSGEEGANRRLQRLADQDTAKRIKRAQQAQQQGKDKMEYLEEEEFNPFEQAKKRNS